MSSTNALTILRERRPDQVLLSEKKVVAILQEHGGSLLAYDVGRLHGLPFGFRTICSRPVLDRMTRKGLLFKGSSKKRDSGLPSYRLI